MKIKKLSDEIGIPENVGVIVDNNIVNVKGEKGSVARRFDNHIIGVEVVDKKVVLKGLAKKLTRKDKRVLKTMKAHIRNMIKGVSEGYEYKLKICSGHFPISVIVEGDKLMIKNFFGEKVPRVMEFKDVSVNIEGDIISVGGADLEKVGCVALRIEQLTRIRGRDRRIFQDGCFIVKKGK